MIKIKNLNSKNYEHKYLFTIIIAWILYNNLIYIINKNIISNIKFLNIKINIYNF